MQHGKKVTLTENEEATIIQGLHRKQTTLQIAKTLNRDHRRVKKFASNPASFNGRSDKGKSRRSSIFSPRMVKRMKREIRRNPFQTSNDIFKAVGFSKYAQKYKMSYLKEYEQMWKTSV